MNRILVPDWRAAWKWFSVHIGTIAVIFGLMPAETQAAVLSLIGVPQHSVVGVIGVLFIVARLMAQGKPAQPDTTDATD